VRELIWANRLLTIRELSVEVGLPYGTCQAILTQDLNMQRVAAKFVPRILTTEQKEWCLSVPTNMLQEAESDENFMGQIITADETWVCEYDLEMKCQSLQWKSADFQRPKKARQVRSKVKVMLIVFFDMEGIVHYEYVLQGQTVNQQFYLQVLKCLRLTVSRKRPQKRAAGAWALHHDNAHSTFHPGVFGKSWHSCRSATTLLP